MYREGLGYDLRNYNPCVNYNADKFCCNPRGYALRQRLQRNQPHSVPIPSYEQQYLASRFSDIPLSDLKTGMRLPQSYEFTSIGSWNVPCGRMPGAISVNKVPCQKFPCLYNRK